MSFIRQIAMMSEMNASASASRLVALSSQARSLAVHEKSLGPNHPDVATALNNLASLLYKKTLLGVEIKQFVTLLLASIGLNIMNSLYAAAQQTGWGADVGGLATALVDTFILLIVIAKVPAAVAEQLEDIPQPGCSST
jgi:hypothetical protein